LLKIHTFRLCVRRRYTTQMQANCAFSSDDEQFFEANDNISMFSQSKVDYVMNVNNLNKDFSERISQISNINHITDANQSVVDKKEELNHNKKRVLLVQMGREDSDS
jgi:hypothetical protein